MDYLKTYKDWHRPMRQTQALRAVHPRLTTTMAAFLLALDELSRQEDKPGPGAIAKWMLCSQTNITLLAQRTARLGWITYDRPAHGRRVYLDLSPEGRILVQKLLALPEAQGGTEP